MGFVSEILKEVKGVQGLYTAGVLIFLALFILILYRTLRMPKSELKKYKNSILDPEEISGAESNSKQNSY